MFCRGGVRVDVEPVYQQTNCIGNNGNACDWMGGTRDIEKYKYISMHTVSITFDKILHVHAVQLAYGYNIVAYITKTI